MAGIVWACGLLPEVSEEESIVGDLSGSSEEEEQYNVPTMKLLEALSTSTDDLNTDYNSNDEISTSNHPNTHFEIVDEENQKPKRTSKKRSSRKFTVAKYRGEFVMGHEDFHIHSQNYAVFHFSDYTWKDQGYAMVNEYFPTITPLIDAQFRKIYTLTYNT